MDIVVGAPHVKHRARSYWLIGGILGLLSAVLVGAFVFTFLPGYLGFMRYQPQEGDVIFQSLPYSPVVVAIEGATKSPYSHCGIVAQEKGAWVVYEAYKPVGATPLREFVGRGRNEAFAVYRWRPDQQQHVAPTLTNVRKFRGRSYDERYRLDDKAESIYCSELIYLAYQQATGKPLGKVVTLGELNWKPYTALIQEIEKAPPPLEREIITPRDLAAAEQLEKFYSFGF
jgi:hypothetical protein